MWSTPKCTSVWDESAYRRFLVYVQALNRMPLRVLDTRLFAWTVIFVWPPSLVFELATNGLTRLDVIVLGTAVWAAFALLEYLDLSE